MSWLESHALSRWVGICLVVLWTLGMVAGALFVKSEKKEVIHYLTAFEALEYMASQSCWGVMHTFEAAMSGTPYDQIQVLILLTSIEEFGLAAPKYSIRSKGLLGASGHYEEIPADYWYNARLEWGVVHGANTSRTVGIGPQTFKALPSYTDIRICESDMHQAWPTPPAWWWT